MTALRRGEAGFTLIEMMVVIAVMGLLMLLIVSRGPPHSANLALRAACGDVAGALRAGRAAAITSGAPVRFVIDPADSAFGIPGALAALPRGVAIAASVRPDGPIVLEPDGSASAAAIRLTLGHLAETVTLDWLTGRVGIGPVRSVATNDEK